MNTLYSKKEFEKLLTATLYREFSVALSSATDEQLYRALALIVRQIMSDKHKNSSAAPTVPTPSRCTTCAWSF